MRTTISKQENNQLPSQVAADQIIVNSPFNPEAYSVLGADRIKIINALCVDSQLRDGDTSEVDYTALQAESCNLQEIFDKLVDFDSFTHFYTHIDWAFERLLKDRPNESADIFRSYKMVTSLFRILNKHSETIQNKFNDLNILIRDLDTLEGEKYDFEKGGLSC